MIGVFISFYRQSFLKQKKAKNQSIKIFNLSNNNNNKKKKTIYNEVRNNKKLLQTNSNTKQLKVITQMTDHKKFGIYFELFFNYFAVYQNIFLTFFFQKYLDNIEIQQQLKNKLENLFIRENLENDVYFITRINDKMKIPLQIVYQQRKSIKFVLMDVMFCKL
ncbi:transmembrane protein, putative (macronuclear) [Tetrahymena thermophila SB210]|uniref:Transmembrane protein, putative n=1 Tax=Tetrahymena thermophila (strain SB210) TaxID=312017 RepID=Q23H58_TETTS|nr:transmembrane protein, putative [Tetrahymena thermophila SB210]EAR95868.2 transmembrane protein, putative [Tetrahymena thermophila SB210]|eukprot:XP_001016113.2 transmembrane protein, putative [Tetrahymena thermophila SB210]